MSDPTATDIPRIHTDPEPATRDIGRPPLLPPSIEAKREDQHEAQRQQSFDSAFAWNGQTLHGFTISRESLFHQLRLAIGAPALGFCLDDTFAFTADAARILWLCAHTPQDWSVLRCSPAAHQNVIDEWAEANIPPAQAAAARLLAMDILVHASRNAHEPAPAPGRPHGDDSGN
jgi:hypothetical protein